MRLATVNGHRVDVGTYIEVVVTAVAEQQDNIPPSRRTETSSDGDTATCDHERASENFRGGAAATLSTAICRAATANPPASRDGILSEVVAGVEPAPEALGTSMVVNRSQSAERERRAAEERQSRQEKQTRPSQSQQDRGCKGQEAEEGGIEVLVGRVDGGSGSA